MSHEFAHTLVSLDFYSDIEESWKEYDRTNEPTVSYNAFLNVEEFVADCFIYVHHTDDPPQVARDIVNKIDAYFKRVRE